MILRLSRLGGAHRLHLAPGVISSSASADSTGQSYVVPCPAADVVTPALNADLIANPGAEGFTPTTALGGPAENYPLPDCWSISSPIPAPYEVLSSAPSPDTGITGRAFFGGSDPGDALVEGMSSTATQLIDVRSRDPGGQPFELSAVIGGGKSSGSASAASELDIPYAIDIDPSTDTLYIADTGNSEIAEVLDLAKPGTAAGPPAP